MLYEFKIDYQDLNQLSYSKEYYEADFLSLFLDGIYQANVVIFINDDSNEDLEYIILNSKHIFLTELKAMNMKGNPIAFTSYLCKCNKCESLLLDQNPQVEAVKQNIYIDVDKEFVNEDNVRVSEMVSIKVDDDSNEYFWACPKCETDDYLTDLE